MVPAGRRGQLDKLADQAAGCGWAPVAGSPKLVLGTAGTALEISDLDGPAGRIPQAIDRQCLAALDLEPGLQCQ